MAMTLSTSRTTGGSLIHDIAAAAQASRMPANVMALFGLLASTLLYTPPNVTFWMSIGMTIIMLMMPM